MRRPTTLLLLLAMPLLLGLSGCGNRQETRTLGETEGVYVDVADLVYQVQISRILNPSDTEDRAYLKGLPPGESQLAPGETWFGVFMRVSNETSQTRKPASSFRIVDTQENEYEPVDLDPAANPFAYQPDPVRAGAVYPDSESAAFAGPIQGTLVLFKVRFTSLQNRPLELLIDGPLPPPLRESAVVDLDV
jgi:hypothetical protein